MEPNTPIGPAAPAIASEKQMCESLWQCLSGRKQLDVTELYSTIFGLANLSPKTVKRSERAVCVAVRAKMKQNGYTLLANARVGLGMLVKYLSVVKQLPPSPAPPFVPPQPATQLAQQAVADTLSGLHELGGEDGFSVEPNPT